jgi:hypothetical protein
MQIKSKSGLHAKQKHSCRVREHYCLRTRQESSLLVEYESTVVCTKQTITLHLPQILNTREMQALRLMYVGMLQDDTHTQPLQEESSKSLLYAQPVHCLVREMQRSEMEAS